jgi:perosamine synthetase
MDRLAIDGGTPVRRRLLPYSRQTIDETDVAAVNEVLRSEWLTTGPKIKEFESALAVYVGSAEAVAVSSGTAALHAAMHAIGIGPADEVIVPALTFVASANCVVYQGATPVFADVDRATLLIDAADVAAKITPRTRAIIAVDYAGQPCDYDTLEPLARRYGLALIADSCHALGATYKGRRAGTLADLTVFSFHPVKAITSGEGGAVTTASPALARNTRRFRNHGITFDHVERRQQESWYYEMVELGCNYRLNDIQCALGISQLKKLPEWLERRRIIARHYDDAFASLPGVELQRVSPNVEHAYHLYLIRIKTRQLRADRARVFAALRAEGIGVTVHYLPVHLHPYYRNRFDTKAGLCPRAEAAYEEVLSLPLFPSMTVDDVSDVIEALQKVIHAYAIEPRTSALAGAR